MPRAIWNGLITRCAALSVSALLGCLMVPVLAAEPEEELIVIGVTPSRGVGLPAGKIPYHVQTATSEDLEQAQSLSVADFLNQNIGSISINEVASNPLQPDVQYRGYSASPLLGLAQGIAVYQNGIRVNEPLGDTVNWDLLPASAIYTINHIGGADPIFGLNTLGGALSIRMKDGFASDGHHLTAAAGSFNRITVAAESGGNNGRWGYYGNIQYFEEDGWRDQSPSDAINFYGSIGWRGTLSSLNLNFQHGNTKLIGNGPLPVELATIDRSTIFTAPDITENSLYMVSVDGTHSLTDNVEFSGNAFYRRNKTDAFNGDSSEFTTCELNSGERLLEGIDEDEVEALGFDLTDELCEPAAAAILNPGGFDDEEELQDFLNASALAAGENAAFELDDLTDELSGSGRLADAAINNISRRKQESYGADLQLTLLRDVFQRHNQIIVGFAYFKGESAFRSVVALADLDPVTRSTVGLATGIFVDGDATDINTETETMSLYFTDTIDVTGRLSLTVSGRVNNTRVTLADRSGQRPELNGEHDYFRFNPAVGATFQAIENLNLYAGYSESSRAPTPIELACNDRIFDLAVAAAIASGDDPDDVDFECRLPNAFLADPPLDDVVTRSFEFGLRGQWRNSNFHLGFFNSVNRNDILFQTTGRSTGLFANIDETRRRGLETSFDGRIGKLDWFAAYTFLAATFEDSFLVLSPNHPAAGSDGNVQVDNGDRIPGLPEHQLKLGGDYFFTTAFSIGVDLIYNSNQVLRGDESNDLDELDGYAVVNLRGRYRINDNVEVFARINNLFDKDFESFGLIGEDPSEVDVPLFAGFSNPRFVGPAAPLSGFIGLRLSL